MKDVKTLDEMIRNKAVEALRQEVLNAFAPLRTLRKESGSVFHTQISLRDKHDNYKQGEHLARVDSDLFDSIADAIVKELSPGRGNAAVAKFIEETEAIRAQLEQFSSHE